MNPNAVAIDIQAAMPKDGNAVSMQLVPDTKALYGTVTAALSTASTITFQTASTTLPATSLIEVNALTAGVYLRWGTTAAAASSTNFDEYIQSGTTRHYAVPAGILAASFYSLTGSAVIIEK